MPNPCLKCVTQDCVNCKIKPKNKCSHICEIWSRCVGYHRPVKSFNRGKQEEFRDRKTLDIKKATQNIS